MSGSSSNDPDSFSNLLDSLSDMPGSSPAKPWDQDLQGLHADPLQDPNLRRFHRRGVYAQDTEQQAYERAQQLLEPLPTASAGISGNNRLFGGSYNRNGRPGLLASLVCVCNPSILNFYLQTLNFLR